MKLHVREWGWTNRVAVLIHGFNCDSDQWWRLAPELVRRGYRVLAPDLRGHGLSARADDYSLEAFAADLIETLPTKPEVMVGHSLGGYLLGMVAGPIQPRRAIYLDPPGRPIPAENEGLFPPLDRISAMSDEDLWGLLRQMFPRWASADVDADVASWRRWDPATVVLLDQLRDPNRRYVPDRAGVPSLLVVADPSVVCPPEAQLEAQRAGFEVRVASGLTHSLFRDDFDAVISLLEGWIY